MHSSPNPVHDALQPHDILQNCNCREVRLQRVQHGKERARRLLLEQGTPVVQPREWLAREAADVQIVGRQDDIRRGGTVAHVIEYDRILEIVMNVLPLPRVDFARENLKRHKLPRSYKLRKHIGIETN